MLGRLDRFRLSFTERVAGERYHYAREPRVKDYDDDHLEAVHHGDKEGDHEDVVDVGHLEEAASQVSLHAAVDQVEVHEEIQN